MKILLIGLGSIGKRHLTNILALGYKDVTVVSRSGILPEPFQALPVFINVEAALDAERFDAAILCTPTALHEEPLLALLEHKILNIYIEKPVSHQYGKMDEILELASGYENNIIVGFDLHFDPGLQKVKELLGSDIIGKPLSANAQVGQYLPDWRPTEDYRQGMSAKKVTGGGVMLDLVHEFDYLLWLMGSAQTIACQYAHTNDLQIETEDVAEVLIRFENGGTGTIHLDYWQQKLVRNCLITGTEGSIFWDLATSSVKWINRNKEENVFDYTGFVRNDRFVAIMKTFLEGGKDDRLTSLQNGIASLKMVLAAKQSSEKQIFVPLQSFKP